MARKENKFRDYGIATQSVHTGTDYDAETGAVRRPLHMANSYKLPDDLSRVNYSSTDLLMYARNGNANQHWLEEKIAALHNADDAIVLASGVGALHALFWTLLKTGDRVVYPKVSYMAVYRMFHELFNNKFGVETVMVDMTDLDAVRNAITPGTRLVHIETPDNPTVGVTDIAAIAQIAHENGAILSVDNTFASPLNQRPLELGADFVVEALTKFINGHGDAQGGAIISNDLETMDRMHCPHCETAILQAVRDMKGIENPRADYRAGTLSALWDDTMLPEAALRDRIAEAGYTLTGQREAMPIWKRLVLLLAVLAMLTALLSLVSLSPLRGFLSRFPTAKAGMGLGALFVVGLLTSLHCVAMCGGINLAQSAASAQAGRRVSASNIQYNLGRLVSYTIVGGIVGAVGSVFKLSHAAQAAIQLAAAIFMVFMAMNLLDIGGLRGVVPTLPVGLRTKLMGKGSRSSLYIGLLNGLMPCGPLQAMQLYALSTGSWHMGALSMFCFCLGTVPLMLGFGLVSGKLNKRFAKPMRVASGALVLLMGMAMLSNGLSLSGIQLSIPRGAASDVAVSAANIQTVESELDWRGYPDITVQAGVPVRWKIHAEAEKITGCNNEMVIPALNMHVPINAGDNIVEFTVDEPGVIPYTCWMGMLRGTITVDE